MSDFYLMHTRFQNKTKGLFLTHTLMHDVCNQHILMLALQHLQHSLKKEGKIGFPGLGKALSTVCTYKICPPKYAVCSIYCTLHIYISKGCQSIIIFNQIIYMICLLIKLIIYINICSERHYYYYYPLQPKMWP